MACAGERPVRAMSWQLEMGANLGPDGVRFRVWAPAARSVEVVFEPDQRALALQPQSDGAWSGVDRQATAGALYRYRLDSDAAFPDPYSRSQPQGPHGPSEVVDPNTFEWRAESPGLAIQGLVIYQFHVGTATREGTFDAFASELPRIKALGANAIEPLPVAEFPGTRNWGYDGVDLFAPAHVYGGPEGLKRLIDAAHAHGLGVILDVVYNHLGPDGNYLRQFSPDYFTDRHSTPWGDAINYDGRHSAWVRRFVIDNARYWLTEFHADGLRLDATHAIKDDSPRHILAELSDCARAAVAKPIVLIAETSENDVRYLRATDAGGLGMDAVWADDFHHTLRRYLAGDHEAYFSRFQGTVDEVARCINRAWLRGTDASGFGAWNFVYVVQNHDQIGNRALGDRLHHGIDLARYRAASVLLLFLPYTPLLFMGQEFCASAPFQYFTDHEAELGRLVTEGRRKEFAGFSAFSSESARERIPDPQAPETFERSKLPVGEASESPGREVAELYARMLRLRRGDAVLRVQDRAAMEARAVAADVLAVRRWGGGQERLLVVNFGDAGFRTDQYGGGWREVLSSGEPSRVDAQAVTVGPRTAAVLARGEG